MKIGIIDADLIGRVRHRFPNLACEKISAYWKEQGAEVTLLLDYVEVGKLLGYNSPVISFLDDNKSICDRIYISKVFTDTNVPDFIMALVNRKDKASFKVQIGGTGFYFDKAPNLPYEIEHHMPDYSLYDEWIESEVELAKSQAAKCGKKFNAARYMTQFKEYTDYSIGFLTRGCFRKCPFCVNQKYDHVFIHSPLKEFYDSSKKKICLLDDNFLGCPKWRELLEELRGLNKPFKFKQGLDERILTDEKCKLLFSSKYDGDWTFAFDNVSDYDLIHSKLKMLRKFSNSTSIKFYVLVGFESTDASDIENAFKRIELLMRYKCLPYIMRYQDKNRTPWKLSKYRGMYVSMARWCNQPNIYKKMSFRQFCLANQQRHKTLGTMCSAMKAMTEFEIENPDIAKKYFDIRFSDYNLEGENN